MLCVFGSSETAVLKRNGERYTKVARPLVVSVHAFSPCRFSSACCKMMKVAAFVLQFSSCYTVVAGWDETRHAVEFEGDYLFSVLSANQKKHTRSTYI